MWYFDVSLIMKMEIKIKYSFFFEQKKTNQASRYAGLIGMLLILGGIFGSLVGGYILDKSKAYK